MDLKLSYFQSYISDDRSEAPKVVSREPKGIADFQLWQEFQAGSDIAYATIYRNNVSLLYSYGLKLIRDKELIKDCIQELFVEIWNSKHKLGRVKSIKSYLFKSIRRKLIAESVKRRKKSMPLDLKPNFLKVLATPSIEFDMIERQCFDQQCQKLKKALEKLTDRQKEIIHLKYYTQLSYDEIAEIMSLSTKGTYKLMGRSISFLRKNMGSILILLMLVHL